VKRHIPRTWILESVRMDNSGDMHPYCLPYLKGRLSLVHRTRIANFNAPAPSPADGEVALPSAIITSDTGELTWVNQAGDGHVLIDTPRHQTIVGRAGRRSTKHLAVDLKTPFAAIQVSSLDDKPLAQSERMLLLTAARATNTDFKWRDDSRQSPDDWGHAPTRIEPVVATLTLRNLDGARDVTLQPLDERGQPFAESRPFAVVADGFSIELTGEPATPWYIVQISR